MNFNNGISYKYIPSDRFKTTLLSVTFFTPLNGNASANALALSLMSKSTPEYPDYYSFNRRLAGLYGATVSSSVSKAGDISELNISLTVNDDKYSLNGEAIVEPAGKLLLDMIFARYLDGSDYPQAEVEREKRLIKESILNRFNDKRVYARKRCEEIMCKDEAYGLSPNGTVEDVEALNNSDIKKAMKRLICESFISVVTVGAENPAGFMNDFNRIISQIERNYKPLPDNTAKSGENLKVVEETMPVTQGKLVIGLRSPKSEILPDSVRTWVMTDIFGGGPYSKLFCNVREKMSLCYYCSARGVRSKGLIFVESGVENDNIEAAKAAIIDQFEQIKNGEFKETELNSSKLALSDAFRSVEADQAGLAQWYDARILSGSEVSPKEVVKAVESVTFEDVVKVAGDYKVDTIYILRPNGAEKGNE